MTEEDWLIWIRLSGFSLERCAVSITQDRRDADLMLSFMTGHRAFLVYVDVGPSPSPLLVLE